MEMALAEMGIDDLSKDQDDDRDFHVEKGESATHIYLSHQRSEAPSIASQTKRIYSSLISTARMRKLLRLE